MTSDVPGAWLTPALRAYHPNLDLSTCSETSGQTDAYNCIAWAADRQDQWFWPNADDAYWPDHIPATETVDAFVRLFESLGYTKCENTAYEPQYGKIVIYAKDGRPTHAARQLDDEGWTSKLGRLEDITHKTLESLEDSTYGIPHTVMRRPQIHVTPH